MTDQHWLTSELATATGRMEPTAGLDTSAGLATGT
jgi:hypothetical protein